MFKTVLVCSDGSDHALKAVGKAAMIAKAADACVLLLHVKEPARTNMPYTVPWQLEIGEIPPDPWSNEAQAVILDQATQVLKMAEVRFQVLVESGHPAETIVSAAKREDVDLIVMGSRGLSGWEALLLGSVCDHVIHHAPCSVLIVR